VGFDACLELMEDGADCEIALERLGRPRRFRANLDGGWRRWTGLAGARTADLRRSDEALVQNAEAA